MGQGVIPWGAMRWLAVLLLLCGFAVSIGSARAQECDFDGLDGTCQVKDGHYRIAKPPGAGPYPAVIYLYGSTGNSRRVIEHDRLVRAITDRGYALVVPIALDLEYHNGVDSGWFLRHERGQKARNEVAYLKQVIQHAAERHQVDRRRLVLAGQSRGGFLIWEMACHHPDLANAYAPHAAGYLGPMPRRCAGPVRMLHTHGKNDPIVPLAQDALFTSGGARMTPLEVSLRTLARTAGCEPQPVSDAVGGFARQRWRHCQSGSGVEYLLHNGDHNYPQSWISQVLDWYERDKRAPVATSTGGGTPVFRGTGDERRPGFKGVGQPGSGTGGRFKRVPQ